MPRYRLRTLLILLAIGPPMLAEVVGCQTSVEQSLQLTYVPPQVPDDISPDYRPSPDSRDANWLEDDEVTIDLRQRYLRGHRRGWEMAIADWEDDKSFHYNIREDVHYDDFTIAIDATWLGYNDARRQIEDGTAIHK